MDTILYNGKIYTEDQAYPTCSAVAIKNGIIMALGDDDKILSLADEHTEKVDLQGKLTLPGFTDSHLHMLFYGSISSLIDLSGAKSLEDIKTLCSSKLAWAKENGKWVQGIGFNQNNWAKKEIPTIKDLDEISTDVPITIRRACYHISVCNSKAMEAMGLLDKRAGETDLNIEFFPDGTPNGVIHEDTQNLISSALPRLTKEEIKDSIAKGCQEAAAKGIVEIHSDDYNCGFVENDDYQTVYDAYCELNDEGRLPIRVYQQCSLWDIPSLKKFIIDGHRTGESHGLYRIGPLKLIMDGSLGAHTALMRKPYSSEPTTCGHADHSDQELYDLCKLAHDNNMQIAVHCIGDGALEKTLNTFQRIQDENPRPNPRHGIVHCQIMDRKQQERFKEQNLLAYVQPVFLRADMDIVDDCVGTELGSQSYNWRAFEDMGVHQSGGSDCPVEDFDILPNIEYAVTRTKPETGKSWYPENSVTLEEAVKMFTSEGAYASFSEDVRGTITVGKYADIAVLDKDIFQIPESEIHNANVDLTMVQGKIVYRR